MAVAGAALVAPLAARGAVAMIFAVVMFLVVVGGMCCCFIAFLCVWRLGAAQQRQAAAQVSAAQPVQGVTMQPVATPMPAADAMVVTCPAGSHPGDSLQVVSPTGATLQVTVPAGVAEGAQFQIQLPSVPMAVAVPVAKGDTL